MQRGIAFVDIVIQPKEGAFNPFMNKQSNKKRRFGVCKKAATNS